MSARPRPLLLAFGLLWLALLWAMLRLAWVSDDAYITLRTVENLLAGHGPTWNVGERAQTYTHPLWMLTLAAGRWLTGEAYLTTIGIGLCLSLLAALGLMRASRGRATAVVVLLVLLGARSFSEFATSGLENPLSYALLTAFAAVLARPPSPVRLTLAALLTGLLAMTRIDLVLLCGPALLAAARGLALTQAIVRIACGLLPLLAWLAFAAFYYGTPFPMTAYAKALAVGIPAGALLQQGLRYLGFLAGYDPVLIGTLAGAAVLGLGIGRLGCRGLALGVLLYCGYVVKVGGDFMAGRFLTPPLIVAVVILSRALAKAPRGWHAGGAACVVGLAALGGVPPWLRPFSAETPPVSTHGIHDERRYYYRGTGLLSPDRVGTATAGILSDSLRKAGRTAPLIICGNTVGAFGFEAGDLVHLVDPLLCDPLLMRLPIADPREWRIGHFLRGVPEGYLESLAAGDNRIVHDGLRRYYGALRTIIRAPLFDSERLRELVRFWRGEYDAGLMAYVAEQYRVPPRLAVPAAELASPVLPGTLWCDDPRVRVINRGGLDVRFPEATTARALRLLLQPRVPYAVRFRRGGSDVGAAVVEAVPAQPDPRRPVDFVQSFLAVQETRIAVPAEVGEFDTLSIGSPNAPSLVVPCLGGLVLER